MRCKKQRSFLQYQLQCPVTVKLLLIQCNSHQGKIKSSRLTDLRSVFLVVHSSLKWIISIDNITEKQDMFSYYAYLVIFQDLLWLTHSDPRGDPQKIIYALVKSNYWRSKRNKAVTKLLDALSVHRPHLSIFSLPANEEWKWNSTDGVQENTLKLH